MGGTAWGTWGRVASCLAALAILGAAPAAQAAAPDTEITKGPTDLIASKKATFKFKATKSGATFECRLNGGKWKDCESPKKLKRLKQGPHEFEVRARKGRAVDKTPALAQFTVDTVPPETTMTSGPEDESDDYTPTFEFTSTDGGAIFECRMGSEGFASCSSPYSPEVPLTDDTYTFQVRAVDAAGNADPSPASDTFTVETPLRADLATAQAIQTFYLPDPAAFDMPASCGGGVEVDCPNGQPAPPTDQISINTTSLDFDESVGQNRVDVSIQALVATLAPIKVKIKGAECDLTVDSTADTTPPDWRATYSQQFVVEPTTEEMYAYVNNTNVTGVDDGDWNLAGPFICTLGSSFINSSTVAGVFASGLEQHMRPICAKPGPGYIAPCPEE
jgi:hypothetical protein